MPTSDEPRDLDLDLTEVRVSIRHREHILTVSKVIPNSEIERSTWYVGPVEWVLMKAVDEILAAWRAELQYPLPP